MKRNYSMFIIIPAAIRISVMRNNITSCLHVLSNDLWKTT